MQLDWFVNTVRICSHEVALAIRFFSLGDSSRVCARKIIDRCYLVRFWPIYKRRRFGLCECVCAPQFKCTIFISLHLATKSRYNPRYWIELYRLNLTTVVFILFLFFSLLWISSLAFRSIGKISFLLRNRHKILSNFPGRFFFYFESFSEASEWAIEFATLIDRVPNRSPQLCLRWSISESINS